MRARIFSSCLRTLLLPHRALVILVYLLYFTAPDPCFSDTPQTAPVTPIGLGIIPPVCIGGYACTLSTHYASLHVLIGVSGELHGFGYGLIGYKTNRALYGWQNACIYNWNKDLMYGIQSAGILNYLHGPGIGIQSSLCNISSGSFIGLQTGGLLNYVHDNSTVLQIAPLINYAASSLNGAQLSFISNQSGNVDGLQCAIFYNTAKVVRGTQIGLVNVSQRTYGLPLGLVNIFTDGFFTCETGLEHDGTLYLCVRHGVGRWYFQYLWGIVTNPERVMFTKNMVETSGNSPYTNYSYGTYKETGHLTYGLGYLLPINYKVKISADAGFGFYMADAKWLDEHWYNDSLTYRFEDRWDGFIDFISTERITLTYALSDRFIIAAGVSHKTLWETTTGINDIIYQYNHKFSGFIGLQAILRKGVIP
jgi:hypothetical protein